MQCCHCLTYVGQAQTGSTVTVPDLQAFDQIFDVDQATWAELGVERASDNQVPDLPLAHGAHSVDIERLTVIDKLVAESDCL